MSDNILNKFIKTYETNEYKADEAAVLTQHEYKHTATLRYKGKVIAFAMDDGRRIWYSVLDFETDPSKINDADCWQEPKELIFPREISQAGYRAAGSHTIGIAETAKDKDIKDITKINKWTSEERFLSTTARLTAAEAKFQVLSDNKYIYLFRQSVEKDHGTNVKTENDVSIVDSTLLVDRFLLSGNELKNKLEVRYQRSKSKDNPASNKDSLGYKDMDEVPFYEPTCELPMIKNLEKGNFAVSLLPSDLPGVERWQFFAFNSKTKMIDSFNIEKSEEEVFDTKGSMAYTCSDPDHSAEVFEHSPGKCQFCEKDLIPKISKSQFAEYCLKFNGTTYINCGSADFINGLSDFTVEAWVKLDNTAEKQIIIGNSSGLDGFEFGLENGEVYCGVSDASRFYKFKGGLLPVNKWTHVSFTVGSGKLSIYVNGSVQYTTCIDFPLALTPWYSSDVNWQGSKVSHFQTYEKLSHFYIQDSGLKPTSADLIIGASSSEWDDYKKRNYGLKGEIDEIRIWKRAISKTEIEENMRFRLRGDEPDLEAYWKFDEGAGNMVHDSTQKAVHGKIGGTAVNWIRSDAPVGDNSYVRRSSFAIGSMSAPFGNIVSNSFQADVAGYGDRHYGMDILNLGGYQKWELSGISSMFYYQQEKAASGYSGEEKPLKNSARVMLAMAAEHLGQRKIAILDFAVSKEGKLAQSPDTFMLPEIKKQDREDLLTGEVYMPMNLLHLDLFGLSICGGLLDFNHKNEAPYLFDSANGKLGLYFRGYESQFFAAYYDVLTKRAVYELQVGIGKILFGARHPVPEMDNALITITNSSNSDSCTVIIEGGGIKEIWNNVPRNPDKFVETLNGENTSYDYENNASIENQPAMNLLKGSLLFILSNKDAEDNLQNLSAQRAVNTVTPLCSWVADPQGNALYFDGTDDYAGLADGADSAAFASVNGDITMEAWIKPDTVTDTSRIITHKSDSSKYTLGLQKGTNENTYEFFAGVKEKFIKSKGRNIPCGKWTHLAAVYNQSYALKFDGKEDYLGCGNDITLDISGNLTIEAFIKVNDFSNECGILTKGKIGDGKEGNVPYSLSVDNDGKLAFVFEDKDGKSYVYKSDTAIIAGEFYKIAVSRETKTNEEDPIKPKRFDEITFYIIDKAIVDSDKDEHSGKYEYYGIKPGTTDQALEIGKASVKIEESQSLWTRPSDVFFNGIISEVRIWNRAIPEKEIRSKIGGRENGLVSWWRFEENDGKTAYDSKSQNHAEIKGAEWCENLDSQSSKLSLYKDGLLLNDSEIESMGSLNYGDNQTTLGALKSGTSTTENFKGTMEEVRLWKVPRTEEQIQDNLFGRLLGEKEELIAYYQFDASSGNRIDDLSGRGNHILLGGTEDTASSANPTRVTSNAPVSYEFPLCRSVLSGVKTDFHDTIESCPAVQEYGDLQYDAEGNMIGTMKRCYNYIKDGKWNLVTGYKVGNIITEWICQVQYDPQLIGFIEGAPPVPGENLTSTTLITGECEDYCGGSAITFEKADEVSNTYSNSEENGFDTSVDLALKLGYSSSTASGILVETEILDYKNMVGLKTSFESSNSWVEESSVGFGKTTTESSYIELKGRWEPDKTENYLAVGRRFKPDNKGLALVKSETADLFAMRLKHNNALVCFKMMPNPDIPKDWNIISFPINPRYMKQGTLDGKIGFKKDGSVQCDPDYPNAATYGEYSYFKPIEAYAIKNRIEKQEQELKTYYEGRNLGTRSSSVSLGTAGSQRDDVMELPKAEKRNICNTYVWTADGGIFSETNETMDFISETHTSSFSHKTMAGATMELEASVMGIAGGCELSAMFGAHLNLTSAKTRESETSFGLQVDLDGVDNDLQIYAHDGDKDAQGNYANDWIVSTGGAVFDSEDNPVMRPGKVDAYRFMSFYLQPDKRNFDDFKNKVVDSKWLTESNDYNALALRKAINTKDEDQKSIPWRIMHRVTFVSRILPEFESPTAAPMEQAMKAQNINSNWELIQTLEPFVKNQTSDYVQFTDAVRDTINNYLPELKPATEDIIKYMCLYYQVNSEQA